MRLDLATRPLAPATATPATSPTPGMNGGAGFGRLFDALRDEVADYIRHGSPEDGRGMVASRLSVEGAALRARASEQGSTPQQAFLDSIAPWARQAAGRLGVAPELVQAHAALESGWGQRLLRAEGGAGSHNLFGIKAAAGWTGASLEAATTEYADGAPRAMHARFRAYPDAASALSGIQAINEQLDTLSNNIANAGTYGFKGSRANFAAVYAGDQAGGVQVASQTQNIGQNGGLQTTGRGLDAAIQGRGFFTSRDAQGVLSYSRVGIFSTNADGYLVDAGGKRVQGYGPGVAGALGTLGDIAIPAGQIPAVATTRVSYNGNMSDDWSTPAAAFDAADGATYNMVRQSVVYDALGARHAVAQYFVKTGPTTVTVHYGVDGAAPTGAGFAMEFDANGRIAAASSAGPDLTIAPPGTQPLTFRFDYSGTTKFAGDATNTANRPDGHAAGTMVGVELAEDGSIVAKYSNEQQQVVGTVALATFADEGSLAQAGDTSWIANAASGAPLYTTPGVGLGGKLAKGSLEGSNVDITAELVGLMTSQRNYQANSKVITAENQMMQSLMQAL